MKIMKKRNRKHVALIMAFALLLSSVLSVSTVAKADDGTLLATYDDGEFYTTSAPEYVILQEDAHKISLYAECTGNTIDDTITVYITDITHDETYSSTIPFSADGTTYTYYFDFESGQYKVSFRGDSDIEKSYAIASFWQS